MLTTKLHKGLITILSFMLLSCGLLYPAVSQTTQPKQSASLGQARPNVIPIEHYYWHYLVHQNQLDQLAAAREAKGQDGRWLRSHLQTSLGFSDADYASVRISSKRLATELNALNAQAATIRATGPSSASFEQLKSLTAQREVQVNAEVFYLRQTLPPDKIAAFEAFMVQFLSHTTAGLPPSLATGKTAPTAVQR
jgi:hypothetical protein